MTGNYDPETNLAFWGTGNGGPWMGDQRPGDNLYTASTIAIDVGDRRRSRATSSTTRTTRGTGTRCRRRSSSTTRATAAPIKGLIDVARNGYLWFLERTDGRINFVEGTPYVKQNVFRSLDPKTGRPDVDPARKPGTGQARRVLSVALGRQELAADRVQPADADDLHPRQREPVRRA